MTRLSPTVKRRLQASLENLTAREAGRLYAVYALEADKKDIFVKDYAPVKELVAAFDGRLAKSRGKPEERQVVALYNGFAYLQNIFAATNEVFSHAMLAVSFDNFRAMSGLLFLLHQDAMTEAIRGLRGRLIDEFPRPVEVEDYDRLLEWAKTDALIPLGQATESIFLSIESQEFIDSLGDREDLVARVESGEADDLADAFGNYIYDQMVAKLEAGELVGGMGYYSPETETVLIAEGYLPAWAALRVAWRPYVRSRGLQIYDDRHWKRWSVELVDGIGANGQELDDDDLRKLVADFYKDCRRRPWGKTLVAKPDPDDLVKLLTQSSGPFLHLKPYDFGRVNWEAFSRNEIDWRGKPIESEWVATVESLNALPDDLRRGEDVSPHDYLRSRYYPTTGADFRRMEIQRSMAMFDRLETTRQPFTFDRAPEDGELSLSEFMGIKFMTPFEEGVERLRKAKTLTLALDVALATISDRYFGGLPVLLRELTGFLAMAKDYLASAEDLLSSWLKELSDWPWKINVSTFRIDDVEADQAFADKMVDQVVTEARRAGRFTESDEELLGGN